MTGGALAGLFGMPRSQAIEMVGSPDLIADARREGALNLVAMSHNWAFEPLMKTFSARYGIIIDDSNSEGSSAEELQAVLSLKGQSRGPDYMDLSPTFATLGAREHLFQPFKVATWSGWA
jgi:putative spermidine/putrescine transport system substrate-binding protein